ncbi:MAG: glycosyltransferase [Janthinobacterium lividum]
MMDALTYVIFALPLLVTLNHFGLASLFALCARSTSPRKNYALEPTVSILLPCFNEGEHVIKTIESIIHSNYPLHKIELIAVDDCSADDTFAWLQKAAQQWPMIVVLHNEKNIGKHHTVFRARAHATGEILICIDSDSIFDKQAIRELTACFVDENIGAVGGRVAISNARKNIFTQGQTLMYHYVFRLGKMPQNWARNVTCISGCIFAVRCRHFDAIAQRVQARNWFGIGIKEGEDAYMTHLLLLEGLKTYMNIDAICWTAAPDRFKQLFMQQLRWRRSAMRDFFWTIRNFQQNVKFQNPFILTGYLLARVLFLLEPAMYIQAIASGLLGDYFLAMVPLFFGIHVMMGVVANMYMRKRDPTQCINPLLTGFLGVWYAVDAFFLTVIAIATFDVGEWGTRGTSQKKD